MRLVTFAPLASFPLLDRLGALQDADRVVDLAAAYRADLVTARRCAPEAAARLAIALLAGDMTAYLEGGDLSREAADRALQFASALSAGDVVAGERPVYSLAELQLKAPIARPRSLRDFIAFEEHITNMRKARGAAVPPEWYELPVYYKGNPATIVGPDADVVWPRFTSLLDYELELACVIGREGQDVPEARASAYIAGYTIMNDFSARDIQRKEMNAGLGPAKGKDFATALGPWLVTPDELPDPYDLTMTARVNGELWSTGNSGTISRGFPVMIAHVSNGERIVPGDVFGSGTVGLGCGAELGRSLRVGDVVELEISGLGVLRNRIVAPA